MKSFENTEGNSYSFSDCNSCDARCCDGSRGSTYAQIILEDFVPISKHFPILFTQGEMQFLMPVVLLSNGNDFCKYIKDFKCSIYDERPSICKLYPLSPYITNEIYIDVTCPAVIQDDKNEVSQTYSYEAPIEYETSFKPNLVNSYKQTMITKGNVEKDFYHEKLNNYQDSIIETYKHFKLYNYEANLEVFATIRDMVFYRFKDDVNDEYVQMHLKTLKHFDDYYMLNAQ